MNAQDSLKLTGEPDFESAKLETELAMLVLGRGTIPPVAQIAIEHLEKAIKALRPTPPALPGSVPADAPDLIAVDDRTLPDATEKARAQALRDEFPLAQAVPLSPDAWTQATDPPVKDD